MTKVRTAIVIGGGIAGPVTALGLRKAGIEAAVFEAYPSTADGVGGSIAIAPNGQAALEVVGAREAVTAAALPVRRTAMSFGGRKVGLPQLEGLPALRLVRRADLYRALRDVALDHGVRIEHGRRLVAAEQDATGVTARFADGSTATADILIGADGIHSTVRTLIDPDAPGPGYTGTLGFEAVVDRPVPGEPGTMVFAFGRKAYYLYWSRPDGRTGWGANLPQDEPMTLAEARAVPAEKWLDRLREAYGDDDPGGELVRHIDPGDLQVTGSLHIMPSVPRWHRGRMVLVGDAVHAPSNSSGQGASLAVESALELARCLRDRPDAQAAFAAYERLRRPRVERIAARAAKVNRLKAPGPVTSALMPLLMRVMTKTVLTPEKNLGPEQRYRVEWDLPVPAGA
ncbi:FAD-dependent oxidoreductase [Thermomonospora cellulosilytica]|uniref:2-polyprenyl-6-methoxyphenol hydroxylase-like FAD-dependent oxidoreductase n=1 Tax=Thermomonospora cellulosilytica TaxID=1411118 RepID=A0A7W3MYC0_9ACTN|nr:NAD(P)/FAD-dependent oxidoreductase [Thermomonospora cellulosilytica]MBA9004131.1 2-polyprenyl-6-methoxyphenol hydroxylase-like FAD-dependent oxidoreductase [Thermomonospora cellulosilytica]